MLMVLCFLPIDKGRRDLRCPILGLLLLLLVFSVIAGPISGETFAENKVKAAFLLKFPDFVDWPAGDFGLGSASIRLGIVGHDPFGGILPDVFPGGGSEGAGFRITRIPANGKEALDNFDLLYFGDQNSKALADHFAKILGRPVLTVGEGESFLNSGGIIAFIMDDHRLRFQIDLKNAVKAGLRISSKLLKLAARVIQ